MKRRTLAIKTVMLCIATTSVSIMEPLFLRQALAQGGDSTDEKVVHLLEEPRHRPVHREGNLYLLDVQVNPGDTSFQHIHDQAILLTTIHTGRGPANGPVRSIPEYAYEPLVHNVSNDGPGLLRIIALVNDGDGQLVFVFSLKSQPTHLFVESVFCYPCILFVLTYGPKNLICIGQIIRVI